MKPMVLLAFLLAACTPQDPDPPADLIARDTFVQVMADVQLIEARINHEMLPPPGASGATDQRTDSPVQRYYEEMYAEHRITKELYARTYQWYVEHPELLKAIYEDVLVELGKRKEEA